MPANVDPVDAAVFLIAAFALAGACQTIWLSAPISRRFSRPIDGGRALRGRRLFGDNKTIRGFVVMVPATAAAFAILASTWPANGNGLWSLTPAEYAVLGGWAGIGFMAGELPNSFLKRQLDVEPGTPARGPWLRPCFAVLDRCDSVGGAMLALAIAVPVPFLTWLVVAAGGPALHLLFSAAIFYLGGKARLA
jgi:CDP-2,3-bis-(O-geranylgeranyl)-sn-glycerol synthase